MTEVAPSDFVIHFGKFKNRTLNEISKEDGRYLVWVYKQNWVNDKTKKAIGAIMDSITLNFGKHNGKSIGDVKAKDPKYYKWLLEA